MKKGPSQEDFIKLQNFSHEQEENDELEIKLQKEINLYLDDEFNTKRKRREFVKKISNDKNFDLVKYPLLRNLESKYLEDWIRTGLSELQQEYIEYKNATVSKNAEKESYVNILKKILTENNFNNQAERSNQEYVYIMSEVFPRFGITTLLKYVLIKQLYEFSMITEKDLLECVDDDDKINKLVRKYVLDGEDKVPTFSTNLKKKEISEEFTNFFLQKDTERMMRFKWTNDAEEIVLAKLDAEDHDDMNDI